MPGYIKENIYYSTSIANTCDDWEIEFNKENKMMYLFDEFALIEEKVNGCCDFEYVESYKIGESLISFFELDLEKYNSLVDEFYTEYRQHHYKPEQIDLYELQRFIYTLEFEHPYFFSLDTMQLSNMNWDDAYQCMKIDLKNASTLYSLINGLCRNEFVPPFLENHYSDPARNYIYSIEGSMLDLFRKTDLLQQRSHFKISLNADEQSIHTFELINRYCNINPLSFCFTEFQKMLEWNIPIRFCKNCNKLFIPDTNHAVDYCNRIDPDTGLTCKKIGAAAQYRSKVNQNPILKEYTKAYKRNYARIGKSGMSNEDFRVWVDDAIKKRDELAAEYSVNPSDILVSEFKKYLGNK